MTESRLPFLAVILGISGLIPFAVSGAYALRGDPIAAQLGGIALISYGAIILSFLGGVHWGFVIEGDKEPAERARLTLGVLPALVGWGAVLLGLVAQPLASLAVLIAAFIATILVEQRARHRELVPRAYIILRWVLTAIVVLILAAVLLMRLFGDNLAT